MSNGINNIHNFYEQRKHLHQHNKQHTHKEARLNWLIKTNLG